MSPAPTPATLADYVDALMEWHDYADRIWAPDSRRDYKVSVNNRLAKRSSAVLARLRAQPDWPTTLETMATSDEPLVRLMAAQELYGSDPERALATLAEIERGSYGRLSDSAHWAAVGLKFHGAPTDVATEEPPAHPADLDPERVAIAEAILAVHGATMNGGFLNAFDVAGMSVSDAIRGYELIGLAPVAKLLRDGVALFPDGVVPNDPIERQRVVDDVVDGEALERLGESYEVLVPGDEYLGELLDAFLDEPPHPSPEGSPH